MRKTAHTEVEKPNSEKDDANIDTADALTLFLHNQHTLGAAMEEITHRISGAGAHNVADIAIAALETLDTNAKAITDAIKRVREY